MTTAVKAERIYNLVRDLRRINEAMVFGEDDHTSAIAAAGADARAFVSRQQTVGWFFRETDELKAAIARIIDEH